MVLLSDLDIVSCNMRFWTVRLSEFSERSYRLKFHVKLVQVLHSYSLSVVQILCFCILFASGFSLS